MRRHDHESRKARRLADELSAVRAAGQAAAAEAAALKIWRGRCAGAGKKGEGSILSAAREACKPRGAQGLTGDLGV